MPTLFNVHGNIPILYHIFDRKLHDAIIMDLPSLESRVFYFMDRAYIDFERLHSKNLCGSFFVLRARTNTELHRLRSNLVNRSIGLSCGQVVKPSGINS